MIKTQSVVIPEYKTDNPIEWIDLINERLRESRLGEDISQKPFN